MGTPHYPPDFGAAMKDINDKIRSVTTQAQSRRPFTTIKTAILTLIGSLVVKGGGSITIQGGDGSTLVTLGAIGTSGTGALISGVWVRRQGGQPAFASYSTPDGSFDFNALYDKSGHIVVSDDGQSGHGLATPWLPMPNPSTNQPTSAARTNSTSFVDLAFSSAFATHPRIRYVVVGQTQSGITGELQVKVNGTQVGTTMSIPSSGNVMFDVTDDLPGWGSTVAYLDRITITIAGRVTSGSGDVVAIPYCIYAVQS